MCAISANCLLVITIGFRWFLDHCIPLLNVNLFHKGNFVEVETVDRLTNWVKFEFYGVPIRISHLNFPNFFGCLKIHVFMVEDDASFFSVQFWSFFYYVLLVVHEYLRGLSESFRQMDNNWWWMIPVKIHQIKKITFFEATLGRTKYRRAYSFHLQYSPIRYTGGWSLCKWSISLRFCRNS